eukprot:TRINITY_DN1340_c0_g1_i1.p2 TRINITY_DN1340_c0_g1~~TRINITY_DN1340_c0_g1_i1.p2  ORF type:complete len:290 (+),score=47.83 TRINITY_DN1340_c0_g1_i1:767-1636(+)
MNALKHDALPLQYLALKILFDLVQRFNLMNKVVEDRPRKRIAKTESVIEAFELIKCFLHSEEESMLTLSVEGFTKLLFLNRLPEKPAREVLKTLMLLSAFPADEKNEKIRQILIVFFPAYISIAPKRNRENIRKAFTTSIVEAATAPKDSLLSTVNLTTFMEFFLWELVVQDEGKEKKQNPGIDGSSGRSSARLSNIQGSTLHHEKLAEDMLLELASTNNLKAEKELCRALAKLIFIGTDGDTLKKLRFLSGHCSGKVKDKTGVKSIRKFVETIENAGEKDWSGRCAFV